MNHKHLKQIIGLRSIAIIGQLLVIIFSFYFLKIPLPLKKLIFIIVISFVVNLISLVRLKEVTITEIELFLQILFDVLILFMMLYLSGGSHNPFASFFILHVVVAATILSPKYIWSTTGASIICYLGLNFFAPSDHLHHHPAFIQLHFLGMLISSCAISLIVSFYVVKMSKIIKHQYLQIKENETLAMLGTFSASAAHELGTPLSTIGILASSIMEEMKDDVKIMKVIEIKREILRCKSILRTISSTAGLYQADSGSKKSLSYFLEEIFQEEKIILGQSLNVTYIKPLPDLDIYSDSVLRQSIKNVIKNAAEASPGWVEILIDYHSDTIFLDITDRGPGFPENILNNRNPGETTKDTGLGLGLFLAKSVVERLEGKFELTNLESGASVKISFPLHQLSIS